MLFRSARAPRSTLQWPSTHHLGLQNLEGTLHTLPSVGHQAVQISPADQGEVTEIILDSGIMSGGDIVAALAAGAMQLIGLRVCGSCGRSTCGGTTEAPTNPSGHT